MKDDAIAVTPPTVNDIARAANVSLATVDRVLNDRPGVRQVTVDRVKKAIEDIGYVRDTAAANLARGRIYRFLFLLPETDNEFVTLLEQHVHQLFSGMKRERTQLIAKSVPAFDAMELAKAIAEIDPSAVDGVAIFGPETPSVRDAIANLRNQGVSVVSMISDIPSSTRDHYVGIDNIAAGRTAAQLMGRFLPDKQGKILVLTGSMLARDHLERRLGFDEVMSRDFPNLHVLPSLEGRDDPTLVEQIMSGAMALHTDVIGIYSSAAGNQGLVSYFDEHGQAEKPIIIAHELTSLSKSALKRGLFDTVISQDAGHLVRSAVRVLRAKSDNLPINPEQERIRIDVYLKENMPS